MSEEKPQVINLTFHPRAYVFAQWLCPCGHWIDWAGWTDKREPKVPVSCEACGAVRLMG